MKMGFTPVKAIGLALGIAFLTIPIFWSAPAGMSASAWHTTGIALLLATWWGTQAIPIHATALIPIVLFPIFDILSLKESALAYIDPIIFLLMGGFIMSIGISKWNLHRRLSLNILNLMGASPAAILLGFMSATAFISMWMSNSAATIMMLPIAISLINQVAIEGKESQNFNLCLLLGIAYSASMGGMGTIIGSPPNAFVVSYLTKEHGIYITFVEWMMFGVPAAIVMTFLAWWALTKWVYPFDTTCIHISITMIENELKKMGSFSAPEKRIAFVFLLVIMAWLTRDLIQKNFGLSWITDSIIAMVGATLMLVIPSGQYQNKYSPLINLKDTISIPWEILILVGGGLSLSTGIQKSGLATWLGYNLPNFSGFEIILGIVCLVAFIVFLTELTSNTATMATLAPMLGAFALTNGIDLQLIFIAAVMSVSCAFMLPIATPPNAIIFSSKRITISQMVHAGFRLNLMAIIVVTVLSYSIVPLVFGE